MFGGIIKAMAPSTKGIRVYQLKLRKRKPLEAMAIRVSPNRLFTTTGIISWIPPISKSPGAYTKTKGTRKTTIPKRQAWIPTIIGSALAIAPAAKAARAIGGVIKDDAPI